MNLKNLQQIEVKKLELEKIREIEIKGKMIRSRLKILNEYEKPSKWFTALETQNSINKTITKLETQM